MKKLHELEVELQEITDRQKYISDLINAYKLVSDYESTKSTDNLVSELKNYMVSHNVKKNTITKVMSAVDSVEGTDVKMINGFVNRLNPQVKDPILQYAWEIRIRRGQFTRSHLDSLKESVQRMSKRGTLVGEKLSWFQEEIETAKF